MISPDPARIASTEDLARCLRQLRLQADKPSFRTLEGNTKHVSGYLPGTRIERIPLRRSTISEVLQGQAFPRKRFLLTFVEACGVDLKSDKRWEQAWDRLAGEDREHKIPEGQTQNTSQEMVWRTTPYVDGGSCIEVAALPETVLIRSSVNPDNTLTFTHGEWMGFLDGAKDGVFDLGYQ